MKNKVLEEEWRDIIGYEGHYRISSFGRIKSIKKDEEKMLKLGLSNKNRKRYNVTTLCKNGKQKGVRVHQLVWDHFGTRNRNECDLQIDHIDENPLNNRIDNLQLLTNRQNISKTKILNKKSCKYTGVYRNYKKWSAMIQVNRKLKFLGNFDTPEEASKCYNDALKSL